MIFPRPARRLTALTAALLACSACHHASGDAGAPLPAASAPPPVASVAPPPRGPHDYPRIPEMLGKSQADQFPLDRVEEEPKRFPQGSAAIAGAPDFLFVLGQGSGWHGFDTLKIEASGEAVLVFGGEGGDPWRRAAFRLSSDELAGLQRELAAIDVFALKRGYFARVDDGTQWFLRVRAAKQRKTVVLDNHFPESIVRVADYVRVRVVPAHRGEIAAAVPLAAHGKLDEPMRWEEDAPADPR